MAFLANTDQGAQADVATLDAILSQDQPGAGAENSGIVDGDTPEANDPLGLEGAEDTGGVDDSAADLGADDASDDQVSEPAETDEGDVDLTDLDNDYSEKAYAQAAAKYSAKAGRALNPADPGDRFLLKQVMERGERITELQAAKEQAVPAEQAPATPAETSPKQLTFQERVAAAKDYAKANVNPEFANQFFKEYVDIMWPGREVNFTQEQANRMLSLLSSAAILQISDAVPAFLDAVPGKVGSAYPMLERVHTMAQKEAVVEELSDMKGADGNPAYPHLERLIDSGAIKRALNSPELKDAVFAKDPYKNLTAKTKLAYQIALGQRPNPEMLSKAAAAGRKQATERAQRVGAGKLPPGNTKGGFTSPSPATNFVNGLVGNSGSKFSAALQESRAKR